MKTCPTCGMPMRLVVEAGRQRVWRCSKWYGLGGDHCPTTRPVDANKRLTIAEIADDMGQQALSSSQEQGRKQAGYRRIAGSITKLETGRQYLSDDENAALNEAASILSRLGDAAEKAKKVKKPIEEDQRQAVARRSAEALRLLAPLSQSEDAMELIGIALVLFEIVNSRVPWHPASIDVIKRRQRKGEPFTDSLCREAKREIAHLCQSLAKTIAWRETGSIDDAVHKVREKVEQDRERLLATHHDLVTALHTLLNIEASPNVVPINTDAKP